ncbi:MAG TPA: tail fiber domain-containing protein [Bryobacteraceae bacterium]
MCSRSGRNILFIVLSAGALSAQAARDPVPLKNWAAPLFWQPNANENRAITLKSGVTPRVQGQPTANPLVFVAMTPCRVVDTRTGQLYTGNPSFGPPTLAGGTTRAFPIQANGNCNIPSIAQGYSFDVAVVPQGVLGFVTMWPYGSAQPFTSVLNDNLGTVLDEATIAPAGDDTYGSVNVYVTQTTDLVIDINGYFAAESDAAHNTATGGQALSSLNGGSYNTADGYAALFSNVNGSDNTATGFGALDSNTSGSDNTGVGFGTLNYNTGGSQNTAVGSSALHAGSTQTVSDNTAVGYQALLNNTGNSNIALGANAGKSLTSGSSNIYIGADLLSGNTESDTIRIGTGQTATYIGGIYNGPYGPSAEAVYIGSNGQLGTVASSIRYKEDVQDMGDASSDLLKLRPVTFRYKQPYEDGSKPLDYGLIAEEVEQIYPGLVVKDKDGQVQTVQYQKLTPMLLNELQKQHEELLRQQEENRKLQERMAALEVRIAGKDPDDQ